MNLKNCRRVFIYSLILRCRGILTVGRRFRYSFLPGRPLLLSILASPKKIGIWFRNTFDILVQRYCFFNNPYIASIYTLFIGHLQTSYIIWQMLSTLESYDGKAWACDLNGITQKGSLKDGYIITGPEGPCEFSKCYLHHRPNTFPFYIMPQMWIWALTYQSMIRFNFKLIQFMRLPSCGFVWQWFLWCFESHAHAAVACAAIFSVAKALQCMVGSMLN